MHEIATIGSILLLNVVRSYSIVTMMLTICQKSPHRQRTNKLRPQKKESLPKQVTYATVEESSTPKKYMLVLPK